MLQFLITSYTREAGVRNLKREIASLCRAVAVSFAEGASEKRVLVVKDSTILGVIEAKTILVRMKAYVDRLSAQIARAQTPMF